jgi:acyl-coenzyme A synthetase/AMP-(fatty) acid ligase
MKSASLVGRLLAHASSHPGEAAIVDERHAVTYGELARGILAAAGRLDALGVRTGDTLALSFGASPERTDDFVSVLYGAGYLGAAILPLYPDVPTARKRQLAETFGARWSVAAGAENLGAAPLPLAEICDKSHISAQPPPRGDAAELPFLYQFSSGTTGEPKVVLFSHGQLCANSLATLAHYGLRIGDRLLPAVPAPQKMGLRYLVRTLAGGGSLINLPFPGTRQALGKLVSEFGVTAVCASPWQLRRLMQTAPDPGGASERLRALACIGAMVSADEVRAFRQGLTPNLYVSYSSTECGGVALLGPQDDPAGGYAAYPEVQLQIVSPGGAALPAEEPGAIRLRVPWMPVAYVGNPAASAQRFRDGWFYPGDTGHLDTRGRLFVHGRDDGAINYGGAKIMPEEVEAVLLTHPGVADAIVTSVPDAMAGEIPVAFVVLLPPTTLDAIKAFCIEHVDAASIPAAILSVERMPRAADGKVERARLKEHAGTLAHIVHSR